MSTTFCPLSPIYMAALFDGRLEKAGVHEQDCEEATPNHKCLTDWRNFLWVDSDKSGQVSTLTRYGMNAPQAILRAIANEFDVEIVSEHEPRYWGYETQEEWETAWAKIAEKDEQNFYNEVAKFVRGKQTASGPASSG